MTVHAYIRVSTTMQANDGESLGVQERSCVAWCTMRGHAAPAIYVESAVSGSIPINKRPEGKRMFAALKKGDTIVTTWLDRLFRSALDSLQTVEVMRKRGINVHVIDGLGEITGDGMGRAFMIMASCFAEMERETTIARIRDTKRDQKARGRFLGGKTPFGFTVVYGEPDATGKRECDLLPVAAEQAIIADIVTMRSTGLSLRKVRAAIETRHGRALSLDAIQRVTHV